MSAHYLNSPPCFRSPGISQWIAPDGSIVNVVPLSSPAGSGGIGQADPEPSARVSNATTSSILEVMSNRDQCSIRCTAPVVSGADHHSANATLFEKTGLIGE